MQEIHLTRKLLASNPSSEVPKKFNPGPGNPNEKAKNFLKLKIFFRETAIPEIFKFSNGKESCAC